MLFGGISSLNCRVLGLFDAFDKNCFIWVDGVKNLVWGDIIPFLIFQLSKLMGDMAKGQLIIHGLSTIQLR